ncbi:MAG: hypothetical protein GY940_13760, partial [bacterium]|nr:hypothetical protein [bacterium]
MTKQVGFIAGLILLAAVVLVLVTVLPKGESKTFIRMEPVHAPGDTTLFRVDKNLRRIYFKKGDRETQLEGIPSINGYYFYLKGKKQIRLNPPMTGEVGFYTYLYMKSMNKNESIDFRLELYPEGEKKGTEVSRFVSADASHPVYRDLTLRKGDRLLLKFSGRGIVHLGRPVI